MKKKERVLNVLNKKEVDRIPAGFWLHFPKEEIAKGNEALLSEHLRFKDETNVDILKIMNENELRRTEKIQEIEDWKKIKPLTKDSELVKNQVELLKKILESNNDDCFTLGTVHGIMASVSHSSGHSYSYTPTLLKEHYKKDPQAIRDVFEVITESTLVILEETIKTGVDGIYYAALGGESDKLSRDEFDDLLKQNEIAILNRSKELGVKTFLHACKEKVDLTRYKDYPADVINWAMNESEFTLEQSKAIFKDKVILGGLDDRSGVLVDGNEEEIDKKIKELKSDFSDHSFILGADCTLPTEIDYNRIKKAIGYLG